MNVARCIKCKLANEKRYYNNREARKRADRKAAA